MDQIATNYGIPQIGTKTSYVASSSVTPLKTVERGGMEVTTIEDDNHTHFPRVEHPSKTG